MAKSRKVIITCAVTGSIHTPSMSPHLPVTAQEIADAAIGAAEAGAATPTIANSVAITANAPSRTCRVIGRTPMLVWTAEP